MIGEERQRSGGGYATLGVARNGDCHREHGVGETEGERMCLARGEAGMSMTRASRLQLSDKNRNQAISRRRYDVWRMFSKVGRS